MKCPSCGTDLVIRERHGGYHWFFRNIGILPIFVFLLFFLLLLFVRFRLEDETIGFLAAAAILGSVGLAVFLVFWVERYVYETIPASKIRRPGTCPICCRTPAPDAIAFGRTNVCPGCKDEYVQRLREGLEE